eukprot:1159813-Pelagomonas_calceolata.AAC.8
MGRQTHLETCWGVAIKLLGMFAYRHQDGCMQAKCGFADPDSGTDRSMCHRHFPEAPFTIWTEPNRSSNHLNGHS